MNHDDVPRLIALQEWPSKLAETRTLDTPQSAQSVTVAPTRLPRVLRIAATIAALLLLPPFMILAVAPMLLFLAPIGLICIPFVLPAMLSGSIAARTEEKKRASWRPARGQLRVLH